MGTAQVHNNGNNGSNPDLSKGIEEEKRKKIGLIENIKRLRRRLAYKLAEQEAIKKLAEMSKKETKNIGYLRRRKERLEFRIATEAFTLDSEKELIRKKNEIDAELEEAIASYRLRRKSEFVASDIEQLKKQIEETNKAIDEIERRLDQLYSNLRRSRGEVRGQHRPKRAPMEQKQQEVSLADIAIIKEKKEDKRSSD